MAQNFIETEVDFIKNIKVKDLNQSQKIGLLGVLVLFIGTFFPILQLGSVTSSLSNTSIAMFKNGAATTVSTGLYSFLIFISALVSAYFIVHQKNKFALFSNIAATLIYIYSFINVLAFANELNNQQVALQTQMQSSIYGSNIANAFSGLTKSYDVNWLGWLIMLIGIAAIFYSVKSDLLAFSKEAKDKISTASVSLKDKAIEMKDKAGEVAQDVKEKSQDITNEVKDKVNEVKTDVKNKTEELKSDSKDSVHEVKIDLKDAADEIKSEPKEEPKTDKS